MEVHMLLKSLAFICRGLFMVIYLSAFTLFVAVDAVKAFNKREHWVPGKALVLSALTISVLNFVDTTTNNSASDAMEKLSFLLHKQLLIDGGRLSICVFIGYILPGMVGSRSGYDLRLIAAFAICLFGQILSELHNLYDDKKTFKNYIRKRVHETYFHSFILSSSVFSVSIIFLICASCTTVFAGYTIRRILSKRIPVILGGDEMMVGGSGDPEIQSSKDSKKSWNDFEEEIFKSWFVARVSQPNYVISRSVVNSASALVVSLCVILALVKTKWLHGNYHQTLRYLLNGNQLLLFELCAMFGFFLVGWAVICCRWITALIYFPKLGRETFSLRRYFCVEEFWTSSIVEVIHIYDMKASPLYQRPNDFDSLLTMVVARMRLHKLLHLLCALQICVVLLSKSSQFIVELVFSKVFVRWAHNDKEGRISLVSGRRYEDFADMLERLCMPGEDPASLWNANRSCITRVQLLMKDGHDKVSLLHFLIQLDCQKSDRLVSFVNICRQAWDLLNLVDYTHIEADKLIGFDLLYNLNTESHQVSMAADKEFCRLQALYEDLPISTQIKTPTECLNYLSKEAVHVLKTHMLLIDDCQNCGLTQRNEAVNSDLHDSMNLLDIAPKYSLYKLCRVVEMEANTVDDLTAWTERSLRNVIAACLSKLPHILIKYSRRLAQEFDEENLWKVIYLAGKARGVMEKAGLQLILRVKQIEEETELTVETTQLESTSE
ncbi:uncharacterized protein LOC131050000 isoform X2 [Cryptomeria japonica]|uniref:uncharacterized protein LOC131050000 isoform X2 n=1 Tax=Cryptomeria japonica TaxID=3369 RepID=UPI0027DA0820|nr:uncharacterized protein LOC131050000 isoform X2 [Cryptomeria japonica]